MKKIPTLLLAVATFTMLSAFAQDASQFTHMPSFELGSSEFAPGDSITIQSLTGTGDTIQPGGTYCVTGSYTLASADEADLSFFITTTNRISTPVDSKQTVHVTKGSGTFQLVKTIGKGEGGYPHLTFYAHGHGIGGVYFGEGQWVLRDKHFSYARSAESPASAASSQALSFTGPNQILFNYLGNSVEPPANLDAAYTKDGLTQAIQTAAQSAGITLKKLEIDDSEFPFLIGIIFNNAGDKEKLMQQIGAMQPYERQGGVGGETSYSMNIVPYRAFPRDAGQQIYRRMLLRESVLHDKITAGQ